MIGPHEVRVWHASIEALADHPARIARALDWLSPDERARYDRFRFDRDRLMFLLGRVMARTLVGRAARIAPTSWQWREGPHGRPEIGGVATSLQFNLAHSAGLVACALADGREVGVDVEDRLRSPIDWALVERYCSPNEIADLKAHGDEGWHGRFLTYWTLKEAYLKARGVGISVPLASISFTLNGQGAEVELLDSLVGSDARWIFILNEPTDRHVLAVAASYVDEDDPTFSIAPFTFDDALARD